MSLIFWSVSADSSSLSRDLPPVERRIRVPGFGDLADEPPGLTRLPGDSFSSVDSRMVGEGCDVETARSMTRCCCCSVGEAAAAAAAGLGSDEVATVIGLLLLTGGRMVSLVAASWEMASALAARPLPRPADARPPPLKETSVSSTLEDGSWCSSLA
jgi:hypothetical protein